MTEENTIAEEAPAEKLSMRDSLLQRSTGNKKLINVVIEGDTYFLKRAKVSARSKILAAINNIDDDASRVSASQIHSLIAFAVDEDGKPLFTHADYSMLESMEPGSPLDELGAKALSLLNLEGMMKSSEKKG